MITFPQLEALLWIARLGTFERAANRLNTTQSTITKRIRELTLSCGVTPFEKFGRNLRLTPAGDALLELAEEAIGIRDRMIKLSDRRAMQETRIGLGVTDFSAQSWLPRFVQHVRKTQSFVRLDVSINNPHELLAQLATGKIDIAVCRDIESTEDLRAMSLAKVPMMWCISTMNRSAKDGAEDLGALTVIHQGRPRRSTDLFGGWYESQGLKFERTIDANSMDAILGLVLADCGAAILPADIVDPLIAQGRLTELKSLPKPPDIRFSLFLRGTEDGPRILQMTEDIKAFCDFSRLWRG